MGYFSNGSEGMAYEHMYCRRCVHAKDDEMCPVWALHMLHNGDQLKKPSTRYALGLLIPEKDGSNGQCAMFWERGRGDGGGEPVPVPVQLHVVRAA